MFAAMIDTVFDSPLGADAVYTAPASGAVGVAVRVVRRLQSSDAALLDPGAVAAAHGFDLRVSEIAQPEEGAALAIDGIGAFRVQSFSPDGEHLVWRLDLDPS